MTNKNITEKIKDGVSMQEIETFVRKYTAEVFLILSIFTAAISSIFDFFTPPSLSIIFLALGAIASIAFPEPIVKVLKKVFKFLKKDEKAIQIAIGVVRFVIAIFIPFLLFAEMGLLAGYGFHSYLKSSENA